MHIGAGEARHLGLQGAGDESTMARWKERVSKLLAAGERDGCKTRAWPPKALAGSVAGGHNGK